MSFPRTLEPEWLDELPAADPRARRSRRDLTRINTLMMHGAVVARELRRAFPATPPRVMAEIGAGDGTFMLRVAEKLPQWRALDVVLLDQQALVGAATIAGFADLGWQARAEVADVFAWLAAPPARVFDVIVANLFLHHFDAAELARMLALIAQRTQVLIACEPRRSNLALLGSRLLGVIGCNDVTRHDAVASVRAGFTGLELSALWPVGNAWTLQEYAHGLFSHCFVAARADDGDDDDGAGRERAA